MNIWYFSAHDQPRGKSSRTYDFAYQLVKKGHRVTMFTNSYCHWTHEEKLSHGEKWRIELVDGIRIVWLRTFHYKGNGWERGVNMLTNVWRSIQASNTFHEEVDVVIGPSVPIGTGWAALKIAKKRKAAFVYEVRDVWPIALVDDGGLSKKSITYLFFRYLEKMLYQNSDRISATMPFLYEHVASSGGGPNLIEWMPNGVNFDRFSGCNTYLGGEQGSLTAMYIGGFGTAHDVITIVRAAKKLQQQGNNKIYFIIIGDGPKRQACIQEAESNGLKNIEFRDPVSKSDVPKLQMEADILMACVLDSDAYRFGLNLNKIYDYFASGRPVIFSGNAPNDPIDASHGGYSIPPEDSDALVQTLLSHITLTLEERVEMGRRGNDYVKKEFDMESLGSRMESLLLRAIKHKKIS
jgi:glycosyltransferase involved in cell wall biosynthesis